MNRVILVPDPTAKDTEEISLCNPDVMDAEYDVVFDTELCDPDALMEEIKVNDKVVAHKFIRNAEDVVVGESYAVVNCIRNIDEVLKRRLKTLGEKQSIYTIVEDLARELEGMTPCV